MTQMMRGAKLTLSIAIVGAIAWVLLLWPVEIPDANSPPDGNHAGAVNSTTSLGQTFVASRNGINRVDVTLAVERPVDQGDISFQIMEVPWKQTREMNRPLATLPTGNVGDFRPGTVMARWYSFQFQPIPDSAGKQLFFSLESKDLPAANSVNLLMFFHNEYPLGEAYINGTPTNAYIVFRAYAAGHLVDLIGEVAGNLTNGRPGLLGSSLTYIWLGLVYMLLAAGVVLATRRVR